MGRRQVVRHRFLIPTFVGSSPSAPENKDDVIFSNGLINLMCFYFFFALVCFCLFCFALGAPSPLCPPSFSLLLRTPLPLFCSGLYPLLCFVKAKWRTNLLRQPLFCKAKKTPPVGAEGIKRTQSLIGDRRSRKRWRTKEFCFCIGLYPLLCFIKAKWRTNLLRQPFFALASPQSGEIKRPHFFPSPNQRLGDQRMGTGRKTTRRKRWRTPLKG